MIYLVRCTECDQAFWLDSRDEPVPPHDRWDRRAPPVPAPDRCAGGLHAGHWVMESSGPVPAPLGGAAVTPPWRGRYGISGDDPM